MIKVILKNSASIAFGCTLYLFTLVEDIISQALFKAHTPRGPRGCAHPWLTLPLSPARHPFGAAAQVVGGCPGGVPRPPPPCMTLSLGQIPFRLWPPFCPSVKR